MAQKKRKATSKKYAKRPVKRRAMRMVRGPTFTPEVKFFDNLTSQTFGAAAGWSSPNYMGPFPVQGTDYTNRIGRKIRVIKIECKYQFFVADASVALVPLTGNEVVCDFWMDTQTKGAAAAATAVYLLSTTALSHDAVDNMTRFKRLSRTTHLVVPVTNNGTASTSSRMSEYNYFSKKVNMEVNYITNAGTLADILDNSVFCCHGVTRAPTAGSNPFTCNMNWRFWFVDI